MRDVVSFHPVDTSFFEELVEPLVVGDKVNPEIFLDAALRLRSREWHAEQYKHAMVRALDGLEPPAAPESGSMWDKVRTRLERFDFRPDATAVLVAHRIDLDLHVHGRPFLITEGSADRVGKVVDEYLEAGDDSAIDALVLDQLVRLDPALAKQIAPWDLPRPDPDLTYRSELLDHLKQIYDRARRVERAALLGDSPSPRAGEPDTFVRELGWRALWLHSRAVPFWVALDVDGLETVCRAAGIEPPGFLCSAANLFPRSCERLPGLDATFRLELDGPRSVGAYVPPAEIPHLTCFLNDQGARIIQAAARHGEGPRCTALLRKIRECACFAESRGLGYVEACGIRAIEFERETASPHCS